MMTGTLNDIATLEQGLPPKSERSHHVLFNLDHVSKQFKNGDTKVTVLKDIDLTFYSGEFAIIYGPSGCGKSTLLHLILGLEEPTSGSISMRSKKYARMSPDERAIFRREKVGMVFQKSEWIKALTIRENVAYPLLLSGMMAEAARHKAEEALEEVGMLAYADRRPGELSGGQQQRVAMARAIASNPWILIADEPTGNLDTKTAAEIARLLTYFNRVKNRMILMVTHDETFLPLATRRVGMVDGAIVSDEKDEV